MIDAYRMRTLRNTLQQEKLTWSNRSKFQTPKRHHNYNQQAYFINRGGGSEVEQPEPELLF